MDNDNNNFQAALSAGMVMADVREIEGRPFAIVPSGTTVADLEPMLPAPTRKTGNPVLYDADSFIAYVNAQKAPGTRLYGTTVAPSFLAVFNDHEESSPGWRDYKASYACPLSVEWKTWTASSSKQMGQTAFAQFIEDNLPDIVNPPSADMLEISRSLEAKKKVNFASGVRLSNGQQELTYEEQISGTAAKGRLSVPEQFTLGIPVLEGGIRYAVEARLRYRIGDEGKLTMWYDLLRSHKIVEDAVLALRHDITARTGLPVFNGKP